MPPQLPKLLLKPKLIISFTFLLIIASVGILLALTQIKQSTESRSKASNSTT